MRTSYKILVLLALLGLSFNSWAAVVVTSSQWRCAAVDSSKHAYVAVSNSLKVSMKQSYKLCVEKSAYKRSCTISASYCTQKPVPVVVKPRHHCVVVDAHGRTWEAYGRHACNKAISYCRNWHFQHGHPNGGVCAVK